MSIGIGFDIHRLVKGRKLILGGVDIPHPKGLLGHSDGDVVLHAVADAVLGAAGLGDIGELFPDTNPKYKNIRSTKILETALAKIRPGWRVENIYINIITEEPKLGGTKARIRKSISKIAGINSVNVKAKTMEGLGEIGAKKAIACQAIVSLKKC